MAVKAVIYGNLRFGIRGVLGILRQQSGSTIVNLEAFTNRATHASPLHRYAPDMTVRPAGAFHGGRFVVCVTHRAWHAPSAPVF